MALSNKKFKSPFKYCPDCGIEIKEMNGRDFCSGCSKSAFKLAKSFAAYFENFKPEGHREYDDAFKMEPARG